MTVVVSDLTVRLDGNLILDRVSLTLNPGQVHAVIGPNGAGKTTLVNAITGFVPREGGEVRVAGADRTATRPHEIALAGIRRTFQHPEPFHTLTPHEHRVSTVKGSSVNESVVDLARNLVDTLGGGPAGHHSLWDLRLIEIARALAGPPVALLLDEPAAGLDSSERRRLVDLIREIALLGPAVLLIEHDISLVRRLAQVVTVLDSGSVIASGEVDVVSADREIAKAYMGEDL